MNPDSIEDLPAALNNLQPSRVRELWKEHVVDKALGKGRDVLLEQHTRIEEYSEDRHAIVHGIWEWSKSELEKLTVWRLKKNKLEQKVYSADDLMNISLAIDQIAYYLHYPTDDDMARMGAFTSRRMRATISMHPVAEELWHGTEPLEEVSKIA